MKKRILAALMLAVFCLMGSGEFLSAHAAAKRVYVISNTLRVYQKPKTSAKTLGTMAYGERLSCIAVSGSWARVKNSSGAVGYCKKSGLSTRNPNTLKKTVYINTANTRVYKLPSTGAKVLQKLKLNAKYTAVAKTKDGKWARLKNGASYGYVQMKYLSATPKKTATKADRIVSMAKKQLGKPYAYGRADGKKFDCSGLARYVYKYAAGITLRRTAAQQAADSRYKKISSVSALKKGDLLCFNTAGGSGCDHVGIYIGSGKLIHASLSKKKVVTSSFDSYWKKAFLYARRIV